jgi:hypothetical protein
MTMDQRPEALQPPGERRLASATVLDYRPVIPRAARRARLVRIGMLVLAICALHVAAALILHPAFPAVEEQHYLGGGVIGTPFSPLTLTQEYVDQDGRPRLEDDEDVSRQYLPRAILYLGLFLLTQWWFLSPRGSWRIATTRTAAPPPRRAALAAGFVGMLLCTGVIATVMELPDWWLRLTTEGGIDTPQRFGVVWIVMGVLWAGWSVAFAVYWRSLDRHTALSRVFRFLLAGTVLEMFLAAPAHAWIVAQRGGECYCQRGTWTGVAFGCTAALWLFGPGALLLWLREKRRREQFIETAAPSSAPAATSAT